MLEFPFCSLLFSLLESLKETGFFRTFLLFLLVFSNAKTIVNLVQERKEEADAEEAARNCTTCSPCLEYFQAFSTRISLPISMIFPPLLSRSLSLSAWLSFFGIPFVARISKALLRIVWAYLSEINKSAPSTTPRRTHMLT